MKSKSMSKFWPSTVKVFKIFNRQQISKMTFFAVAQTAFSFLDLLGIVLVGVLTSLIVRDFVGLSAGTFSSNLLEFLRISESDLVTQISILSILALTFFTAKGFFLGWTNLKIFDFFGREAANLSFKLFQLSQQIPYSKLNSITSQRLIFALTGGSTSMMMGVGATAFGMIADVSLVLVILCGLFVLDFFTTFTLSLTSLLFFSAIQIALSRRTALYSEIQAGKIIESQEDIHVMKYGFKEILVSGSRQSLANRFFKNRESVGLTSSRIKIMPMASRYALDIFFIFLIIQIVLLQVWVSDFPRGIANLSVFFAALLRLVPAMQRLQQSLLTIKSNLMNIEVTFDVFKQIGDGEVNEDLVSKMRGDEFEPKGKNIDSHGESFNQEIILRDVSLRHSNDKWIIKNFNLSVGPKSKILITGESGSGKTSLLDLMMGVHRPNKGIVLISQNEPRKAFEKWPGKVMYLPQEITLFRGSLRDNILFTQSHTLSKDIEISQLMREVELGDLFDSLPLGLDTNLGDRGNSLSGGQKQRIGLVRALLVKPEILILDEATNALDSSMEQRLMDLVINILNESIVIAVSHSKLNLENFDRVVNVDNGILQR